MIVCIWPTDDPLKEILYLTHSCFGFQHLLPFSLPHAVACCNSNRFSDQAAIPLHGPLSQHSDRVLPAGRGEEVQGEDGQETWVIQALPGSVGLGPGRGMGAANMVPFCVPKYCIWLHHMDIGECQAQLLPNPSLAPA